MKGEKNKLIETFQSIIGKLASEKTVSHRQRSEEIKEDFSSFYGEFKRRTQEVMSGGLAPPKDIWDSLPMKFTQTVNPIGERSKHEKTDISDNLQYSPSLMGSTYERFGESKYVQPFTKRDYPSSEANEFQ